jgi:hypothetical protein
MFSEQKEIFGPQEGGFRGWVYWRLALFFLYPLYFALRSKTPLTQPQKGELKKEIETIFRNTYGKNAGNVTLF